MPVPDGQNSQPEGGDGQFELQLQLFELQKAERQLNRERERHRKEEEALTEAQRESMQETLRADALERASNEATEKLIELDLRMGKTDQLKAVVEKDVPNLKPLREAAQNDSALAQIMDAYETVKELYNDNVKVWPPKTPQQRHMVAASAVAMRELLVLGQSRLDAMRRGVKGTDNMWQKAQRRIPLGASADVLNTSLTTDEAIDATFKDLSARASALFGTPSKPGIDLKMAELSAYLPDDPRALGIADGFLVQLQRFVLLTQKKGADGKITASINSDPEQLSQVEDAIIWMERSADALKRYATQNPRVKQYMDGTLPRAVTELKPEASQKTDEPKPIEKKQTRMTSEKTKPVESQKIPERIAENITTVSTSDASFEQWEDRWIESGKNSFFDRINTRYKAFREIRRSDKENALIVGTYDKLLPMLKRYAELESAIPHLTGQEAKASDMRAIEQVLIDVEAALTEFESAWSKKDVPAEDLEVNKNTEKDLEMNQSDADPLLRGLNISVEKENGVQSIKPLQEQKPAPTPKVEKQPTVKPAAPPVETKRSFETPVSDSIRIRNGGQIQFIEQNGAMSLLYTLDTRYGNPLTVGNYGLAQYLPESNEWVMQKPANVREVRGAVEPVPEDPSVRAEREKFAPVIAEYFQQPGGLDRLVKRFEAMYAGRKEMLNDKPEYGGTIEWKTYAQEMLQLVSRYLLSLSNGGWPTDQAKRIELLSVAAESEQLIADYKTDRDTWEKIPPEEQDGPWKDVEKQKLPWDKRVTEVTATYDKLKAEFASSKNPKIKEAYDEFRKTMAMYSNIYTRLTAPNIYRDDRQIVATVEQMERVLHYFEPKLRDADSVVVQPVSNERKGSNGFFDGLLNKASEMANAVSENGASNAALEKTVMENMFQPGQPRFEIRQNLILGSTLKPLQKLSEQEVESLLYIKAHLPDFAGMDGRLNANDLAAVVDSIHRDVMSRPYDLHKTIMREKNIQPGSYQDVGLQKALGLVQVMTGQESQLYNKGLNAESRPLTRWFFRTFRGADYNKLQNAKAQLGQLYAVRAQIPTEVRANIDKQLRDFVEKSHLTSHATKRDSGHAAVTEADMRTFEKHAAVLKEVSKRSLKDVVERTGAKIETYLPDGLSVEFIDWMLDAQARADGRKGAPPGSTFWIEGAPVSTGAERREKAGPVANKKLQDSAAEDADIGVDLGTPSVDLGSPSVDLGAPEELK